MIQVNSVANLKVIEEPEAQKNSDSPKGKAFILITGFDVDGNPCKMAVTLNCLGMAGGAAAGVAKRYGYDW